MTDASTLDTDAIIESLRQSFIDTVHQKMEALDAMVDELWRDRSNEADILMRFKGEIHSLKGMGGTFKFPIVSIVSHHFENYLENIGSPVDDQLTDIETYLDHLRSAVDGRANPDDAETDKIVASLPIRADAAPPTSLPEISVLVITPTQYLRQLVTFFLEQAGCQVSATNQPFAGFRLAIETKPDLVICSVVMGGFGGLDLLAALRAIPAMANVHFALLSGSSDRGELAARPPDDVPVISTDNLDDEIANLLKDMIA